MEFEQSKKVYKASIKDWSNSDLNSWREFLSSTRSDQFSDFVFDLVLDEIDRRVNAANNREANSLLRR